MFDDRKGSYSSLLEKCGYTTLLIRHIKPIAAEDFKSLNNLKTSFANQIFEAKSMSYDYEILMFYSNLSGRKSHIVNTHSQFMEVIYRIYCPMKLSHVQKSINSNLY